MSLTTCAAFFVGMTSAVVIGQTFPSEAEGNRVLPERRVSPDRAERRHNRLDVYADADRKQLREDFIRARGEFADVTAAALTSEELLNWVKGLSARMKLQRAEQDLWETEANLRGLEESGQADSDRASRLAGQARALQIEVERLQQPGVSGLPAFDQQLDTETVRRWLQGQMAEETAHLADTLPTYELERRTKRLHRLVTLARIAGGLRSQQNRPIIVQDPQVMPAESTAPADDGSDSSSLGQPTTTPPELPPVEQTPTGKTAAKSTQPRDPNTVKGQPAGTDKE